MITDRRPTGLCSQHEPVGLYFFLSNYAVSVCFSCQKAALIVKKRKAAAETTALRWILYHSFSGNLKGTVPVILVGAYFLFYVVIIRSTFNN